MSNTINYRKLETLQTIIDRTVLTTRAYLDSVNMHELNVAQLEEYSAHIQRTAENFSKVFKMYEKETLEERDGEHIVVKAGVNEDLCMSYLLKDVEFRRLLSEKLELINYLINTIESDERIEAAREVAIETRLQNGNVIVLRGTQATATSVDTNTNDEKTHNDEIEPQRPSR